MWDVKIGDEIEYFDPRLSYELTGYRPISKSTGLDFSPEPFRQAAITKEQTGRYNSEVKGSRKWRLFWQEEKRRCIDGYTVGKYRVTGDHYFFLNYYPLPVVTEVNGKNRREEGFAEFYDMQYQYFHYLELAEKLGLDVCVLKSRGVGFSEIAAALGVNTYTQIKGSTCIYTAFAENYLIKAKGVFTKVAQALDYLNQSTETAFRHLRQKIDQTLHKRASKIMKNGEEVKDSHGSELIGIVVDNPRKLRGARVDRLFFEEAGSYQYLIDTYVKAEALVEVMGTKIGTRIVWGTGGDEGPTLVGLEKIFTDPKAFKILPYYNNFNEQQEYVTTGFFVPAYTLVRKFMDSRGVTDHDKAKEYYQKQRDALKLKPDELIMHCAEYCFTPQEALSRKGENRFNREKLLLQQLQVETYKTTPVPTRGYLDWIKTGNSKKINGVEWREDPAGNIVIVEHPVKEEGKNLDYLYAAGIDSIDQGTGNSVVGKDGSSFCIVVKKRTYGLKGDVYVCYYKDRPRDEREAYENSLKILIYYNCLANLEDSKRTIISYYREQGQLWRLIKRPTIANPSGQRHGNLIGTPASPKIISHQLNLISQYVEDFSHNIFFPEMLNELLTYTYANKTKFDMVAAMGMTELYDEDISGLTPTTVDSIDDQWVDLGYYTVNGVTHFGALPKRDTIEQHTIQRGPIKFIDKETDTLEFEW